jgi:hypothetical protein
VAYCLPAPDRGWPRAVEIRGGDRPKFEEISMENVTRIRDEGQTLRVPTGKVLGIVNTRAELETVAEPLRSAGFNKITTICDEEGVHLLERVSTFFFSDMEEWVLNRHIDELKADHIILGIETPSERVDEAVDIAKQHGARRLVHFGLMTVA